MTLNNNEIQSINKKQARVVTKNGLLEFILLSHSSDILFDIQLVKFNEIEMLKKIPFFLKFWEKTQRTVSKKKVLFGLSHISLLLFSFLMEGNIKLSFC